jgi:copper chaperone CopZ
MIKQPLAIDIEGMTSNGCISGVQLTVSKLDGVSAAVVAFPSECLLAHRRESAPRPSCIPQRDLLDVARRIPRGPPRVKEVWRNSTDKAAPRIDCDVAERLGRGFAAAT